jgi:hypothetical protein
MAELKPHKFIGEPIEVIFFTPPAMQKKPGAPQGFKWRDETFSIVEILSEWHDYQRRGRMARNMRSEHAERASRFGSWGVGRDYYRVRTDNGKFYDIYYDRAPGNVDQRKGQWYLDRELI